MSLSLKARHLIRDAILYHLGDNCAVCGSGASLEIHHKNPTLTGMGRGSEARSYDWLAELPKNNLSVLCHDCHLEIHKALKVRLEDE